MASTDDGLKAILEYLDAANLKIDLDVLAGILGIKKTAASMRVSRFKAKLAAGTVPGMRNLLSS